MRTSLLRHGARTAVAALALTTALAGAASADTGARHDGHGRPGPRPVEVSVDAHGIQAPRTARAGLVAFHVTTDDPKAGQFVQAFRPRHGVSLHKLLADLAEAVNRNDPSVAARGITAVNHDAQALGGAQVTHDVPETFTTPVSEGPVYLLDFGKFLEDPSHPVVRKLELRGKNGRKGRDLADFPDGIVITKETSNGPRFDVNGVRRAKDNILVHNSADELHEMELQAVPPGTTDAQLQAYFDHPSGPPPFAGMPTYGLGVISPGRTALLQPHHLPKGTYALLCFVPDDEAGIPHAFEGMHKVVVLH
ncbi:hypothetical protein [Streptomyces beihaiensis]|uniref:Secreted protein n=1 Tax=Streptomyces beihaiensis TaxID=2984495 RepID=A0ABT3U3W3_9ACTN|nr:hypothetical protein [Streptomyces beihaiensis]MCX3063996.1 hypothetical protein [Streptomyces beihaiensis]